MRFALALDAKDFLDIESDAVRLAGGFDEIVLEVVELSAHAVDFGLSL